MSIANLDRDAYFVSLVKDGIFSISLDGVLTPEKGGTQYIHSSGYLRCTYNKRYCSTHRLVWCYFFGVPTDNTLKINHIDGNKLNNNPSNLELVSDAYNTKHAHTTGLISNYAKGERCGASNFKESEVIALREGFLSFSGTLKEYVRSFDCPMTYICAYKSVSGLSWGHIAYLLPECKAKLGLKKTKKISESVRARIIELFDSGLIIPRIMDITGCSYATILKYVNLNKSNIT